MDFINSFWPSFALAIGLVCVLLGVHWLLIGRHSNLGSERRFPRQIVMLVLSILSVVTVILALPIDETARNRLIGLIGLLVSGVIAFSSTNLLANLMGGILLRITRPFQIGDFVQVAEYFGRVTERGLFDTEIQTEKRELIALPNAYLISHPITTTRSSGAIVSATLSLGYDVHHARAEPVLLRAAEKSGLEETFVHILEMGNFSVTYRVSGLLTETKQLITAHSNLCRSVLDELHGHGIEIMSPTFMNQRRLGEDFTTIPREIAVPATVKTDGGEQVVFDKADEAERKEKQKQQIVKHIQDLEGSLKEVADEEKSLIKKEIESARERLKAYEELEVQSDSEDTLSEQRTT